MGNKADTNTAQLSLTEQLRQRSGENGSARRGRPLVWAAGVQYEAHTIRLSSKRTSGGSRGYGGELKCLNTRFSALYTTPVS